MSADKYSTSATSENRFIGRVQPSCVRAHVASLVCGTCIVGAMFAAGCAVQEVPDIKLYGLSQLSGVCELPPKSGPRYVVGGDYRWRRIWENDGLRWRLPKSGSLKRGFLRCTSGDLSGDGDLAVARYDGRVEIYDFEVGTLDHQVPCNQPLALAWSNDGDALAVLSEEDLAHKKLSIYDHEGRLVESWIVPLQHGRQLVSLPIHDRFAISWSPDNQRLAVSTKSIPVSSVADPSGAFVARGSTEVTPTRYYGVHFIGDDVAIGSLKGYRTIRKLSVRESIRDQGPFTSGWGVATTDPRKGLAVIWRQGNPWQPKIKHAKLVVCNQEGEDIFTWGAAVVGLHIFSSDSAAESTDSEEQTAGYTK